MNSEIAQPIILSSRRRRIAAFLIDHFTLTFLLVAITFLALGPGYLDDNNFSKMTFTILAVMVPGLVVYFAKDSIKGISIGKWIMGIMVRDENDPQEIPSNGRLILRNLYVIIWPVEFIALAVSKEKKRLGDRTAKTVVLQNPNKASKTPRILALAGVGLAFFIFMFLFIGASLKNSVAYKVAVIEIERNEDIMRETGGIKGYGFIPTGSVNIANGNGQAQFIITVLGIKKDLDVSVYLTKESGSEWKLIELTK